MKRFAPNILICAGAMLLLISSGLLIYSRLDDYMAGLRARQLLEQVQRYGWESIELNPSTSTGRSSRRVASALINPEDEMDADGQYGSARLGASLGTGYGNGYGYWEYYGQANGLGNGDFVEGGESGTRRRAPTNFYVIGVLGIPRLNLTLPVLNRTTYALLDISVCRFTGTVGQRPERLVIAGHNFRSHFGNITSLSIGDEITFTTNEGETFRYAKIRVESCHMSDSAAVHAGDDWDITLLTCQRDRTMRTLVRFREI